jgi:hypothetical protein
MKFLQRDVHQTLACRKIVNFGRGEGEKGRRVEREEEGEREEVGKKEGSG